MVKVKISKKEAKIIDDSESTPGQSRQFDLFEDQVMPIFKEKNIGNWMSKFNELNSDFYIQLIEYDIDTDETIVKFRMNGDN